MSVLDKPVEFSIRVKIYKPFPDGKVLIDTRFPRWMPGQFAYILKLALDCGIKGYIDILMKEQAQTTK